jgi:glyoxylase-like metal-dependent hydrolase (beta-lactamase superfamily II)
VALIDPGPDVEDHVRALSRAVEKAREVRILLTHGHSDHAGGAASLARATGARVFGPGSLANPEPGGRVVVPAEEGGVSPLVEGDEVRTDQGVLRVVAVPGHTRDHLAFQWEGEALFVGDLLLGTGDTTWLGEYPGCVADYLASLEKVRELAPAVLYPAHGPAIHEPEKALDRYRTHRLMRIGQVEAALENHPEAGPGELVEIVYGKRLHPRLEKAARASMEVILHHLREKV